MRLDLFLKLSRIVPRRTMAKKLCDEGKILLNGQIAKSAHTVSEGDSLEVSFPFETRRYRVEHVPTGKNVSRKDARELVTLIDSQRKDLFP